MSHRLQIIVPVLVGEGDAWRLCSGDCRLLDKGGWLDPPVWVMPAFPSMPRRILSALNSAPERVAVADAWDDLAKIASAPTVNEPPL